MKTALSSSPPRNAHRSSSPSISPKDFVHATAFAFKPMPLSVPCPASAQCLLAVVSHSGKQKRYALRIVRSVGLCPGLAKRPNNMLNPARFARWTAPLYAGLPVSIKLGGATIALMCEPVQFSVFAPHPLSVWHHSHIPRFAQRRHASGVVRTVGHAVASRTGRQGWYSLRVVRSVGLCPGFAKRPNNMLNPAHCARWTAPLYAGLPVSITVRGRDFFPLSRQSVYVQC
jgi:hypothetical protein